MTLCDLVTVFAETKSVTKSRLHCTLISTHSRVHQQPVKKTKIFLKWVHIGLGPITLRFIFSWREIKFFFHIFESLLFLNSFLNCIGTCHNIFASAKVFCMLLLFGCDVKQVIVTEGVTDAYNIDTLPHLAYKFLKTFPMF